MAAPREPRPQFNFEEELATISQLELPEDIEAKAKRLRDDLVTEWNKGKEKRDIRLIDNLLKLSKVLLTKFSYLPIVRPTSDSVRHMVFARDILEIGVWFSIAKCEKQTCNPEAIRDFERNISQLKHYYFDMRPYMRESEHMYEILGMNLLNLLSQYKIKEFHLELELFVYPNVDAALDNPYIKKAVEIEQYITEGQYNKLFALKKAKADELKRAGLTSAGYKYFIDHLETTLKEHTPEIATVLAAAYDKLSVSEAMELLNLKDSGKLNEIIKKQKWTVKDGYIYFHAKKDNSEGIPAKDLIHNALRYADEMELIV